MAERRDRTAEEREAARRERERRRSGVFNEPMAESPPPEPYVDYADEGLGAHYGWQAATDEPPADAAPVPVVPSSPEPGPPAAAEEPVAAQPPDDGDEWFDDDDDDDEALEQPSGTRRVSRIPAGGQAARPGRASQRSPRRQAPGPTSRGERHRRAAGRGSLRWVGRGLALVAFVLVAAALWFLSELYQVFGTSPHGRVTVVVPAHAGAHQIGDLLAREGVVPSGFFFDIRATLAGDRGKLRAGTYHLQRDMSYGAALKTLMTPPPVAKTTDLTIIPGHTRAQVAKLLHKAGVKGNYLAATRHSPVLDPRSYGAPRNVPSLEGFLYPDTFRLVVPVKMSAVVADQLRDFKQHVAKVDFGYARSKHLTPYDVLKIASLIDAEAAVPHDRPLIASVIYNRLHDGMYLQFDSTTRYATGNFTGPLTVSQLQSQSPYNTHTHPGLPPTPIDSPSLAAIQAAAHPAKTSYLYFFTKPCNAGTSVYTSTYSEFLHLLAVDRRDHCPSK